MFAFVLSLALISGFAFAGGANGGGTDHLPDDYGTAWFLQGNSHSAVNVCIQKDEENFPIENGIIQAEFLKALAKWKTYVVERDIYDSDADDIDNSQIDPVIYQLNTNFQFQESCDGADLTLYLGVMNEEVQAVKESMFDPYAFVHRKSYDPKTGWGQGFMWLKGVEDLNFLWDNNKYLNLHGVFLHELGHIFGNEHITGTIMDENFGEQLTDYEIEDDGGFFWRWYSFYMLNIDWSNELSQRFTVGKFPELGMYIPGTKAEKESFKFAQGRYPVGQVRTNLSFEDETASEFISGTYQVADDQSSKSFPITLRIASANVVFGERKIFARLRKITTHSDDGELFESDNTISSDSQLLSVMGWMDKDGKKIPVVFEGVAGLLDPGQYAEDRREDDLAERKYPYRMLALDGADRHYLYARYEWFSNRGRKAPKLKRFQHTSP